MKAVIFDFNGTLFLDTDKHTAAWRRMLVEKIGYNPTEDEFKKHVIGSGSDMILKHFVGNDISAEDIRRYAEMKERLYIEECLADRPSLKLIDGAEALFDRLSELGVPFLIATGSGKVNIDFYFEYLGLRKWFSEKNIVYENHTFAGKPAPDIYLIASSKIGVDISECVVFEDSLSGLMSAKAAGAGKIVILSDGKNAEIFKNIDGVSLVIPNYCKTEEIIKFCDLG